MFSSEVIINRLIVCYGIRCGIEHRCLFTFSSQFLILRVAELWRHLWKPNTLLLIGGHQFNSYSSQRSCTLLPFWDKEELEKEAFI